MLVECGKCQELINPKNSRSHFCLTSTTSAESCCGEDEIQCPTCGLSEEIRELLVYILACVTAPYTKGGQIEVVE